MTNLPRVTDYRPTSSNARATILSMNTLTLERAKDQLATLLRSEPTMIFGDDGQRGVVMSLSEFSKMSAAGLESWQETLYLLSSTNNQEHLLESIQEHQSGLAVTQQLIDL